MHLQVHDAQYIYTLFRKSRICSRHFRDGKPTLLNPYPTEHLGYAAKPPSTRKPPADRKTPPARKSRKTPPATKSRKTPPATKSPAAQHQPTSSHNQPASEPHTMDHTYFTPQTPVTTATVSTDSELSEHNYCGQEQETVCRNCQKLREENSNLKKKLEEGKRGHVEKTNMKPKATELIDRFVGSDKKVCQNTGLQNKEALDSLYKSVEKKVSKLRYWRGTHAVHMKKGVRKFSQSPKKSGPTRKLSSREELILVLMRLRLGVTNTLLCDIFGISQGLCSKIVNTWIPFLASHLKSLIFWPAKETILQHMPPGLGKKYPQLRCTIDCTEIFIEKPRLLTLQQNTWSDYKRHNTAKYLIGITPNGTISFLSNGYGGRSSDKNIVLDSGFLDLVDPGDVILADRGFPISSELLQRQAHLEIPPPSSGWTQQTREAVSKTKQVANARIHVERAIGRVKWFAFLKRTVPLNMVPLLDDILVICAALSNLRPPLVGT
ncbi:PREDICTED: uncharacterized protein LOC109480957 [Branchiostoma belcheri]|uniref:Uncharacterized protein LOC109480957 n=1 Tax=Branchiostoma belcheri TaxID=7741 RepID=A0A6P4ZQ56_BRABE|nr:PREDICTED: uncharacterized protein LOC109480957 [Branchiostoma belcheri]